MTINTINYLDMNEIKSHCRNTCVLCNSTKIIDKIKFPMPVFMGVNKDEIKNEFIEEMSFLECEDCGEVQINELLDPNIIYQNNHNVSVIGELWKNHYIELKKFIENDIEGKILLEISDPSAKIAKLSNGFKKWVIVEPNPNLDEIPNDIEIVKGFFDKNFSIEDKIDIILHSHLLEHIFNPNEFFKKCYDLLNDDGCMIISIPNMDELLNKGYSPNNILHFEHTYFINEDVLEFLAINNGFEVVKIKKYENHSIFFKLQKKISLSNKNVKLNLFEKFNINFNQHKNNIKNINEKLNGLKDYHIFLFGAHVSSQFYIYNGLKIDNILNIIDNDVTKSSYNLYGTDLIVRSPIKIKNINKCVVICSHVGVYYEEIKKQLKKINKNVIIL